VDFKSEIFVESKSGKDSSLSAMERFFWMMYDHFKSQDEAYIKARHKGKLSGCATAISNTSSVQWRSGTIPTPPPCRSRLRHNRPKRLRITVHEQEQRLHGLLLALCMHLRYCFIDAAMKYCATITVGRIVPYQIPTGTNPMQTSSGTSPSAERSSCCRLPRLDAPNPR